MGRTRRAGMMARGLAALSVVVALVAAPAVAQVSESDLEEARAEITALRADLDELAAAYGAAVATEAQLEGDIDVMERQIAESLLTIRGIRDQISARAVDMYMEAAGLGAATVFGAANPSEVDTRSEYLGDIGRLDLQLMNSFTIRVSQFESEQEALDSLRLEQAAVAADLEALAADVNERLESADARYADLYDLYLEEERQRQLEAERLAREAAEAAARAAAQTSTTATTTPPAPGTSTTAPETTTTPPTPPPTTIPDTSGQVCPVDGITSFTDTWGAPRSGGRFHQGVDMLAARGTAVVAVEAGSVKRMSRSDLGGITVWLSGDSGDEFYYAHLDAWAPGLAAGQRVSPGTLLGVVGTTGNAPEHIPHLHWEFHPGGGGAVNPTPLARSLC